ncbi:unnamed protein product [Brassica oleracea]
MSLKLVDYESLKGDVKKCRYAIRGGVPINFWSYRKQAAEETTID